jgi:hypothetical protein
MPDAWYVIIVLAAYTLGWLTCAGGLILDRIYK